MFRWLLRFAVLVVLLIGVYCGANNFGTPAEPHRVFYPNGQLWIECPLDSAGRLHGKWMEYHPSGRLKAVFNVSRGQMDGRPSYSDPEPDDGATIGTLNDE